MHNSSIRPDTSRVSCGISSNVAVLRKQRISTVVDDTVQNPKLTICHCLGDIVNLNITRLDLSSVSRDAR